MLSGIDPVDTHHLGGEGESQHTLMIVVAVGSAAFESAATHDVDVLDRFVRFPETVTGGKHSGVLRNAVELLTQLARNFPGPTRLAPIT